MTPIRPAAGQALVRRSTLRPASFPEPARVMAMTAMVVAAIVVADALAHLLPGGGLFLLLLVPVIAASLLLDARASILAIVLGAIGAGLLAAVRGHPWLTDPGHLLRLGLFVVDGVMVVGLVSGARRLAAPGKGNHGAGSERPKAAEALTGREIEVLALAADGLTTKAIAGRLFLSAHTVKTHLSTAYGKLGARNRAEAVAAALDDGWIIRASDGRSGETRPARRGH